MGFHQHTFNCFYYSYISGLCFYLVPPPNVSVIAPNPQTVGQSLTLQCEVTTVKGVIEVDIVWMNIGNGMVLRRRNTLTGDAENGNRLVYRDSYTIQSLSTTNNGTMIQCKVEIDDVDPTVTASDSVTLDVYGECDIVMFNIMAVCTYVHIPI